MPIASKIAARPPRNSRNRNIGSTETPPRINLFLKLIFDRNKMYKAAKNKKEKKAPLAPKITSSTRDKENKIAEDRLFLFSIEQKAKSTVGSIA